MGERGGEKRGDRDKEGRRRGYEVGRRGEGTSGEKRGGGEMELLSSSWGIPSHCPAK